METARQHRVDAVNEATRVRGRRRDVQTTPRSRDTNTTRWGVKGV